MIKIISKTAFLKVIITYLIIIVFSSTAKASEIIIAVDDLFLAGKTRAVSDKYHTQKFFYFRNIGKGFSELIAHELGKSVNIIPLKRKEWLEASNRVMLSHTKIDRNTEQDALSENISILAETGRNLSARYVVYGNIYMADDKFYFKMGMIDVKTGKQVWEDEITESIAYYEYITGYMASSILNHLNAEVPNSTASMVNARSEKRPEAIAHFSNALNYMDTGFARKYMRELAIREMASARKMDQEKKLFDNYLKRAVTSSAQLTVWPEIHAPVENPARLGLVHERWYTLLLDLYTSSNDGSDELQEIDDEYRMFDQETNLRAAMAMPLFKRIAVGFELIYASNEHRAESPSDFTFNSNLYSRFQTKESHYGLILKLGSFINRFLSLGAAFHVYPSVDKLKPGDEPEVETEKTCFAGDAGFLFRLWNGVLVLDGHTIFTSQEEYYLDTDKGILSRDRLPLVVEGTVVLSIPGTYLSLLANSRSKIYTHRRNGYTLRNTQLIEYWVTPFTSLQGGYDYARINLSDRATGGGGIVLGLKTTIWGYYLAVNFTRRYRPIQVLPGYGVNEDILVILLTSARSNVTVLGR